MYIEMPKDLEGIKRKFAFGYTKRQLIIYPLVLIVTVGSCVGLSLYTKLPIYINLIISVPLGILILAFMWEVEGIEFERYIKLILKQKYLHKKVRYRKEVKNCKVKENTQINKKI